MWKALTKSLLRNRLIYISAIFILTCFFGYEATKIELSYNFAKILPDNDSSFIAYQNFKKNFGEDGSVMAVGIQTPNLFKPELFNDWINLTQSIKKIDGIKDVLSLGNAYKVNFDDSLEKFSIEQLIKKNELNNL